MPIWGRCTDLKQRCICNLWTYIRWQIRNVVVPKIAAKLWNWSAINCSCFLNTILQNWKKVSKCGTSCICACRERSRHIRRFHILLWMCDMHRKNTLLAKTNQQEVYIVGSSMCIPLPKGHARFCWNAMAHPRGKMAEPWKETTYYPFFST